MDVVVVVHIAKQKPRIMFSSELLVAAIELQNLAHFLMIYKSTK